MVPFMLASVGIIVAVLVGASRIAAASAAFLRAFIPLIDAFYDVRDAIDRRRRRKPPIQDPGED